MMKNLTPTEKHLFYSLIFIAIVMVGGVLNILVVTSNSCKMPVLFRGYDINDENHFSYNNLYEANYSIMSDILFIRTMTHQYSFSIGDILLIFGSLGSIYNLTLFSIIIRRRYKRKWKVFQKKN